MSLKSFHIIFIVISSLMTAFFALWAVNSYTQLQQTGYMAAFITSALLTFGLVIYGWKIRTKLKDL